MGDTVHDHLSFVDGHFAVLKRRSLRPRYPRICAPSFIMPSFSEIPTLRLSDARDPSTKPAFLTSLRDALLNVGFLYLSDTGLPQSLIDEVIRECRAFFEDLPEAEKMKVEMKNEKSFLGYSKLGNEITAGQADWREQLDLVCTFACDAVTCWGAVIGPSGSLFPWYCMRKARASFIKLC